MGNANGIRAGAAYIELFADDSALVRGLKGAQSKLKQFDQAVGAIGKNLLKFGAILAAPFVAGTKTFGDLEQALAGLKNKVSPDDFNKIKESINGIGERTGTGAEEIVGVMTELGAKGFTVANGMTATAESILKFAKVAGVDATQAVTIVTQAVDSFKESGATAAHVMELISQSATAGQTSISNVADAFSAARTVFSQGGATADTLATSIAVLADSGIHGAEAGGALANIFSSVLAPGKRALSVMQAYGISVRDAAGDALPFSQIISQLGSKLNALNPAEKGIALKKLFGGDGVKAGQILLNGGAAAFKDIADKMNGSKSVAEKYATIVDTLYGVLARLKSVAEQVSNAIGEAIAGPVRIAAEALLKIVKVVRDFAAANKTLILTVAAVAFGVVTIGAAFTGFALIASVLGAIVANITALLPVIGLVLGGITAALSGPLVPILLLATAVTGLALIIGTEIGKAIGVFDILAIEFNIVKNIAVKAFGGIVNALKAGDIQLAARILWAGLKVIFLEGADTIQGIFFSLFNQIKVSGFGFGNVLVAVAFGIGSAFAIVCDYVGIFFKNMFDNVLINALNFQTGMLAVAYGMAVAFGTVADQIKIASKMAANISEVSKIERGSKKGNTEYSDTFEKKRKSFQGNFQDNLKGGDNADPLGIKTLLKGAQGELSGLIGQATAESADAASKATPGAPRDPVKQQADRAAGIPQALKEKKFESLQTFNSDIAGRIGVGGTTDAKEQNKLLSKIADNGDKTNALLAENEGYE